MAANAALQRVNEQGWRRGFTNLFRRENSQWWRTRTWLVHAVIWLVVVNGIVAAVLWSPEPTNQPTQGQGTQAGIQMDDPLIGGSMIFVVMCGLATGIGGVLVMQGLILDEKKSGTAAWILSKPVSRSAFILSKLIANGIACVLIMVVLQGIIAYILITARSGSAPSATGFVIGVGLVALNLVFYLTLTLMLGTLFKERGPVIGIPLALLFGAQMLQSLAPWLNEIMPWALVIPKGQTDMALAMQAMLNQPLSTTTPIIATALWSMLFIAIAIWRFHREEF
jgi:ABC-2 type transport system permease protein